MIMISKAVWSIHSTNISIPCTTLFIVFLAVSNSENKFFLKLGFHIIAPVATIAAVVEKHVSATVAIYGNTLFSDSSDKYDSSDERLLMETTGNFSSDGSDKNASQSTFHTVKTSGSATRPSWHILQNGVQWRRQCGFLHGRSAKIRLYLQ